MGMVGEILSSISVIIKLSGDIVWCRPEKVCIVEYMPNTLDALRQPVFKGIRDDV